MEKKLPFLLRLGLVMLGQQPNFQPNFDEIPVDPQLNPQEPSPLATDKSKRIWTSIEDSKPPYYSPISIRIGNKVMDKQWARVSDGDNDFYVVSSAEGNNDNRVIRDITHWSDTVVTPENVDRVVGLKLLIKLIEEHYVPLTEVIGFNKERSEGFNQGIGRSVEVLEREIRRLSAQNKS